LYVSALAFDPTLTFDADITGSYATEGKKNKKNKKKHFFKILIKRATSSTVHIAALCGGRHRSCRKLKVEVKVKGWG